MKRVIGIVVGVLVVGGVAMSLRQRPVAVELCQPGVQTVREYIAEEAKTRLADEYVIDAPVSGTIERITLAVGDEVAAGDVLARMETHDVEQQIRAAESLIAQTRAQIDGVDISKPKTEDIDTAAMRVKEAQDALEIAEKEHSIAGIDFNEAEKDYERAKKLLTEGVASQSEFDQAERRYKGLQQNLGRTRLAVEAARKGLEIAKLGSQRMVGSVDDNEYMREVYQAEIERQEAQLNILRSDLEKMVIRAPVSGPILEKYIENHRVLMAGTPLLKLGDLASMEIECDVLSEEVVRVREGNEVEIIGKALRGKPGTGTVKRVYPSAFMKISSLGIEQQRVKTLIDFDNAALGLRAGTRVDVRIITEAHNGALAVPERATFRREGQWYVFVVEGGRARLRPVTLGLKNDEWAEVLEGLSAEETIISEPMNELDDGMRVEAKA